MKPCADFCKRRSCHVPGVDITPRRLLQCRQRLGWDRVAEGLATVARARETGEARDLNTTISPFASERNDRSRSLLASASPTAPSRALPTARLSKYRPAPVALPGSRGRRSSAGGFQRSGARPGFVAAAVRGCSTFSAASAAFRTPGLADSSRVAVTNVTSHVGSTPSAPSAKRVDGERGSQSPPVCRPSAARLANTPAFALSASHTAGTSGTTATPPSLATRTTNRITTNLKETK